MINWCGQCGGSGRVPKPGRRWAFWRRVTCPECHGVGLVPITKPPVVDVDKTVANLLAERRRMIHGLEMLQRKVQRRDAELAEYRSRFKLDTLEDETGR